MIVRVGPTQLLKQLVGLSISLFVVHCVVAIAADVTGRSQYGPVTGVMHLGVDSAVPTWISSLMLGACAVAAFVLGARAVHDGSRDRRHWLGLGAVFVALSLDDVAMLHERWGDLHVISIDNPYFRYGWVVGGAAFVAVFVIAYIPFLRRVDSRFRWMLLGSGVVFVSGALGIEMLNAALYARGEEATLRYALQTGVEELFELLGTSLALYALVDRISGPGGSVHISICGVPNGTRTKPELSDSHGAVPEYE